MRNPELILQGEQSHFLLFEGNERYPCMKIPHFKRETGDLVLPATQTLNIGLPGYGCPAYELRDNNYPYQRGFRSYQDSTMRALNEYNGGGGDTYVTCTMPGSTKELKTSDRITHTIGAHAQSLVALMKMWEEEGLLRNKSIIRLLPHSRGARVFLESLHFPEMQQILGRVPSSTQLIVDFQMPALALAQNTIHPRIALLAKLRNSRFGDSIDHLPTVAKLAALEDLLHSGFIEDDEKYFSGGVIQRNSLIAMEAQAQELLTDYNPETLIASLIILKRLGVGVNGIFAEKDSIVDYQSVHMFLGGMVGASISGTILVLRGAGHTEHLKHPVRVAEAIHVLDDMPQTELFQETITPQGDLLIRLPHLPSDKQSSV